MNIPCLVLTDIHDCCDIVPRYPKQLVFPDPSHFHHHVTCRYLQDRFDFAMVNLFFSLFPKPLIF